MLVNATDKARDYTKAIRRDEIEWIKTGQDATRLYETKYLKK